MRNKYTLHPSLRTKTRDVNHVGIVMTLLVIALAVLLSQYGDAAFQVFVEWFK